MRFPGSVRKRCLTASSECGPHSCSKSNHPTPCSILEPFPPRCHRGVPFTAFVSTILLMTAKADECRVRGPSASPAAMGCAESPRKRGEGWAHPTQSRVSPKSASSRSEPNVRWALGFPTTNRALAGSERPDHISRSAARYSRASAARSLAAADRSSPHDRAAPRRARRAR